MNNVQEKAVLLEVRNLSVRSPETTIVLPANFTVRRQEPFTLLGETGCGKSLLMHAIMGVLPPALQVSGTVLLEGADLLSLPPDRRRMTWGRQLALLPQEPWLSLDPTMRVEKQVQEGLDVGVPGNMEGSGSARRLLTDLGLAGAERKFPFQLSGGMAQRVAFAAACAGGAEMVLADEPTKGLDTERLRDVVALLLHRVAEGAGLLTITHDVEVARQLGGRIAIMCDGIIVEQGVAEEVLQAPGHPYSQKLLAAEPSRWIRHTLATPAEENVDTVLRSENLGIARGGKRVLRNQNFVISRGEIVGVTGPSGCGKSTFGDALLGLIQPDEGWVEKNKAYTPLRFQKLYQDPPAAFPRQLTLGKAMEDLVRLHAFSWHEVRKWMERLHLGDALLARLPSQISGGELQRFALLRILLLDPVFLFADEPTSRLDLITQQEVMELLAELARKRDCALLLVSHHQEMVERVADRIHPLAVS